MGEAVCGINEPLISVIVPVYKVEPYLRKCVDSILAQTYQNLEIILVDDGSPDGCPAICDEYAKVDQRVKVIHKANGGLSDARNAGMDAVSGDYLMFVDSDDWISCDHVENLYRFSGEKVVAVCNFHFVNEDGSITENKLNDEKFAFRKNTFGYVWNKMYPKSIIGKHYFAKVIFTEDHSFNLDVYFEGVKYEFIESTTYYYRQRKDSILHSRITLERALKFKCSSQYISKSLQEAPNYLIDESVKWEEYYRIIGNHV